MNKNFILFFLFIALLACDKKSETEKAVEEIPMEIKVERFDKAFFETKPEDLQQVKQEYPLFFPIGTDDSEWLSKMQDPIWREVYTEVQKKYANFAAETDSLEDLFRHIKYYFPQTKNPKAITIIGDMIPAEKVIYADSLVVISLELYLGNDHEFYTPFSDYLKQNFEPRQMMPDVATAFAQTKIIPPDNTLLSQMVYFGKELYLKDLFIPDYTDAEKIGYKPEQLAWAKENEAEIWRYFIEKQLLYASDLKLPGRFINPAPFSKFYLELDNESPGRIGQWIGWQVVRSFMENNEVSLQDMLKMDAKQLFEKSRYKPKKK